MEQMILRPDAKGRINLGDLAKGVSSYRVNISESGNLIMKRLWKRLNTTLVLQHNKTNDLY